MRFGPNSLSVNSNTSLKDIYGFKANVRKASFYSVFPPNKETFNTHNTIDKASHARKRRVLSQAFSDSALKSMEKYILANVRTFCTHLGQDLSSVQATEKHSEEWNTPQNMAALSNYFTFDVMGELCFGKAFGMFERSDNRFAIDLIGNAAHRHLIVGGTCSQLLSVLTKISVGPYPCFTNCISIRSSSER